MLLGPSCSVLLNCAWSSTQKGRRTCVSVLRPYFIKEHCLSVTVVVGLTNSATCVLPLYSERLPPALYSPNLLCLASAVPFRGSFPGVFREDLVVNRHLVGVWNNGCLGVDWWQQQREKLGRVKKTAKGIRLNPEKEVVQKEDIDLLKGQYLGM